MIQYITNVNTNNNENLWLEWIYCLFFEFVNLNLMWNYFEEMHNSKDSW